MLLSDVPCAVLPGSSAPSYDLDIATLRTTAATTAANAAHANSVWVASCNLLNVCGTCDRLLGVDVFSESSPAVRL
jgi:hypothetical protein